MRYHRRMRLSSSNKHKRTRSTRRSRQECRCSAWHMARTCPRCQSPTPICHSCISPISRNSRCISSNSNCCSTRSCNSSNSARAILWTRMDSRWAPRASPLRPPLQRIASRLRVPRLPSLPRRNRPGGTRAPLPTLSSSSNTATQRRSNNRRKPLHMHSNCSSRSRRLNQSLMRHRSKQHTTHHRCLYRSNSNQALLCRMRVTMSNTIRRHWLRCTRHT